MNAPIEQLLEAVPEHQRESLRRRYEQAVSEGWTHLGLFVGPEFPPDESDLFGVMPPHMQDAVSKKKCAFVPLPPDVSPTP